MTLTLHVDAPKWRSHLTSVVSANPGIVPVIKGNGYGFGLTRLAREAARLKSDVVAVGTSGEVLIVEAEFGEDILVLSPWHPAYGDIGAPDPRVIRTVSHLDALRALAGTQHRVLVELRTGMQRHGLTAGEVAQARTLLASLRFEGWAVHLPLAGHPQAEVDRAARVAEGSTLWVSHLVGERFGHARRRHPEVAFRSRVGTALWLGDRSSFAARATVLDVHTLPRGTAYGYRQRELKRDAQLLVVSGGTAHGIGMEAPKAARGVLARTKVAGIGVLGAAGRNLSPFVVAGSQRWYAEPPHMQVSMILLPADVAAPAIGDEVTVDVRMTTTTFDAVDGL